MKYFLLMGGFAGFAIVMIASLYAGNRPAPALRDAAIGLFVGGMLFRMLHAAYIAGIKGCISDRLRAGRNVDNTDDMEGQKGA
jgi:hypothetical protein